MSAPRSHRVLVTGAGSGIGAALAGKLCRAGHTIVVTDLDAEAARSVASQLTAAGGTASSARIDVTDANEVSAVVEAMGPIDTLVNNAGLQYVASLEQFPSGTWQHIVNVLLVGAAFMTRAVLPGMRSRAFGRIVNVGSLHSLVASPYKSAYVAAKHGLLGLSKTVALEVADVDVTINTICPAYVRTPLVDKQTEAQSREHGLPPKDVIRTIMLAPMPKKTLITTEEIAALTQFLMSEAARNITAQAIAIDGGWTAQ